MNFRGKSDRGKVKEMVIRVNPIMDQSEWKDQKPKADGDWMPEKDQERDPG